MWTAMWGEEGFIHSIILIASIVTTVFAALFMVPYLAMVALGRRKLALRTDKESDYGGLLGWCHERRIAIGLAGLVLGPLVWYNTRLIEWSFVNPNLPAAPYEWTTECTKNDYQKVVDISIDIPRGCVREAYYISNWHRYGWQSPGRASSGDRLYYRIGNDAFAIQCERWGNEGFCDVGQIYRNVFVVKNSLLNNRKFRDDL